LAGFGATFFLAAMHLTKSGGDGTVVDALAPALCAWDFAATDSQCWKEPVVIDVSATRATALPGTEDELPHALRTPAAIKKALSARRRRTFRMNPLG
jgi:hypothetical protein